MPYLHYLCLFAHSGVQHILCCVFVCFSSSCVPYVGMSHSFFFGIKALSMRNVKTIHRQGFYIILYFGNRRTLLKVTTF